MLYCGKCGKVFSEGQQFCATCGNSVDTALESMPELAAVTASTSDSAATPQVAPANERRSMAQILMTTVSIVSLVLMLTFCARLLFRGIINSYSFDLLAPYAVPDILAYLAVAVALFGSVFAVVFARLNLRQPSDFYAKVLMWMLIIAFIGEVGYIGCEIAVYAIKIDTGKGYDTSSFNFIIMLTSFVLTAIAVCAVSAYFSKRFDKDDKPINIKGGK